MRFKWFNRAIGLLAWLPQALLAVGLGEITVHSTLNQALDAEIQILNVTSGELPQDLKPELASQQEFDNMHLARPFWLTRMQFQIEKKTDDSYCIHLRSATPIREPIVNFLLKLSTPDGSSLLKEYLFFLDLPDMDQEKNQLQFKQEILGEFQHKTEAIKKTANSLSLEEKVPTKDSSLLINDLDKPIKKEGAPSPELAFRTSYGPTTAEESLADIVQALSEQYPNATADQVMLGIVSKNPLSFQFGDVNQMKTEMILELPDEKSVLAVPADMAKSIVQYQKQQQPYRAPMPVLAAVQSPTVTPVPEVKKPVESPEPVVVAKPETVTPTPEKLPVAAPVMALVPPIKAPEPVQPEPITELAPVSQETEVITADATPIIEPISPAVIPEPAVNVDQTSEIIKPIVQQPELFKPEPLSFWEQYGWIVLLGGVVFALLPGVFLVQRARAKRKQITETIETETITPVNSLKDASEALEINVLEAEQRDEQAPSKDLDPLVAAQQYVDSESIEQAEHVLQRALLTDPNNLSIVKKLIEIYASHDKADNIASLVSRIPATVRQKDPKAWMFIHSVCRTFDIPCEKTPDHLLESDATMPVLEDQPAQSIEPVIATLPVLEEEPEPTIEPVIATLPVLEEEPELTIEPVIATLPADNQSINTAPSMPLVTPEEALPMMVVEEAPILTAVTEEEPEVEGFKLAALDSALPVQSLPKKQDTVEIDTSGLKLLDPDAAITVSAAKKTLDETALMTSITSTLALDTDHLTAVDTDDETLVNEIIFEPVTEIEEPTSTSEPALTTEPGGAEAYLEPSDLQAKLELAKRYIDMGEKEDARDLLTELVMQGDSEQRRIALELIEQL